MRVYFFVDLMLRFCVKKIIILVRKKNMLKKEQKNIIVGMSNVLSSLCEPVIIVSLF